ncbi:PAS domain-containing protein [Cytophaga aurantiaca]|uniref:PAS domain-containing protein n=1 Tax=Cytophaga aurantiaca TaxID=29530 RepID=UPI00037222A1|nr:PAS domain-containing protein [Cytophaga aurantiaca]
MELTENKDLFQVVFDSAANGIAAMQPIYNGAGKVEDFSILLFNKYILNWIENKGYKGKRYTDVFPMAKENDILEKFIAVAETGIKTNFERLYVIEGINHWFCFTAVKQSELVVVTVEDITKRKVAEAALKEALDHAEKQERLYDSITNNTPDLVYVFSLDYRFTYANKALLTMWGKSAEEAIGRGLRENGYEEWHAQMHEREIDEVTATKKSIRGTVSFPHAELGSRVYDYILVPVLNEKGEVEVVAGTTRDITELKHAQEKLQKSEARFRSLLQEAPVAATLFRGPDLIIEIANELTQQYWRKGKDIIGKTLAEAAPELEEQQMIALLKDIYEHGGTANFSETPITFIKDGVSKEGYYSFSVKALYNNAGKVDGILSIGNDVTEQVNARKQLEWSGARLKSMIDQTPAPTMVLMGDDLVVEQINKSMLQMMGRGEEVIGKPLLTVMPELEGQYVWEQVQKVYREGTPFDQSEVYVSHKRTGELQDYYYNISYRPLKEEGRITGMIQVAVDVTEQVVARKKLQESEEKFRQMADLIPQIIWTGKADGFIDYYNKRWYEYTGFKGREFGDHSWVPILHPDDAAFVMEHWYGSVQKGTSYQLELRLKNAETGEYRWFLSKAVPIKGKEGIITKWFGTCTDIHEQKTITEKLESLVAERTKELKRSNEDLQQFAHVASHDLKEPVRKIKTFAGRLEEQLHDKLDESAIRFIEKINNAANRMSVMIEGVLTYSTINAGTQKSELVDLNDVFKHIETDLEIPLHKTGGTIEYRNLPALEGAPVLLYQLFYNLINNSIKFAKADVPPKITVATSEIQNHTNFCCITVEDNGIGFESELSERIFETFSRLNSKDKYEGTGLGLSLCKKIVERHGGTIVANSSEGKGAMFIITLPLRQKGTGI